MASRDPNIKQLNVDVPKEYIEWIEDNYDSKKEFIHNIIKQLKNNPGRPLNSPPANKYISNNLETQMYNLADQKYSTEVLLAVFLSRLSVKEIRKYKSEILTNYPLAYKFYKKLRAEKDANNYPEKLRLLDISRFKLPSLTGRETDLDLIRAILDKLEGTSMQPPAPLSVESEGRVGVRFYSPLFREALSRHLTFVGYEVEYDSRVYPDEDPYEEYEHILWFNFPMSLNISSNIAILNNSIEDNITTDSILENSIKKNNDQTS